MTYDIFIINILEEEIILKKRSVFEYSFMMLVIVVQSLAQFSNFRRNLRNLATEPIH